MDRPYSSIVKLKKLRDIIAHGKPEDGAINDTVEVLAGENVKLDLKAEWESFCSDDAVSETYDDVNAIWKDLLKRAGIPIAHTLTSGMMSVVQEKK